MYTTCLLYLKWQRCQSSFMKSQKSPLLFWRQRDLPLVHVHVHWLRKILLSLDKYFSANTPAKHDTLYICSIYTSGTSTPNMIYLFIITPYINILDFDRLIISAIFDYFYISNEIHLILPQPEVCEFHYASLGALVFAKKSISGSCLFYPCYNVASTCQNLLTGIFCKVPFPNMIKLFRLLFLLEECKLKFTNIKLNNT